MPRKVTDWTTRLTTTEVTRFWRMVTSLVIRDMISPRRFPWRYLRDILWRWSYSRRRRSMTTFWPTQFIRYWWP